jgi:membrane peptidoglycan carboxypeptidase
MYIISNLISIIIEALVKIGDIILYILLLPLKISGDSEEKKVKRYIKKGEFKLHPPKKKNGLGTFSGKALRFTGRIIKKILKFFLGIIWAIIIFPAKLYSSYRERKRALAAKKAAELRRMQRAGYRRPSLFYKLKYVFVGFVFSSIFVFLPLVAFIFVSDLPNLSDLSVNSIPKTTKILDRNGTLLYEIYANQNRSIVNLSDVPKNLRNATIAIEDKDFYAHPGFDLRGIIRAFVTNVRNRGFQGGSTITQQLVKSAFLTSDPTIIRKLKEIALAFMAERIYTKDQILELYLNYVPYGGTAWGIVSAADVYFGKDLAELDLAESSFLAGLPQSPSTYSPFINNGDRYKRRQSEVLNAMVRQGYIKQKEADVAYKKELVFKSQKVPLRAPHFVMYVRNYLIQKYGVSGVERGGLTVKTTLDLPTQEKAQEIVTGEVEANSGLNIGNGAALITTPETGDIVAMVGSRNYFDTERDGNVNLTTSLRQPGSAIKLITYTLALTKDYTEATILDDTPLTIQSPDGGASYSPVNYDGAFHGRIPLRTAFGNSFNIPPVRIAQKLGPDAVKNFGLKMGISSWEGAQNYGVSITLGGLDTRMTDLATAYGTISNGGARVDLDPLLEVKDSYGVVVYKKSPQPVHVVDEGVAFIISDILADANARRIEFGLNTPLTIPGAKVSVKTGTTDNKRDNWTVGYTPNTLVATWVGNNDNSPMNPALASGITGAAPMWNKLMTMMIDETGTPSAVTIPSNVVRKFCAGQYRYFIKGTENSVSCAAPPSTSPSPTPATL